MSRTGLVRGLTLAVLGALALTPTVASASNGSVGRATSHVSTAAPTTRMVDNDGRAAAGNCNSNHAASSTIQDAVNSASNGDTILVCPGTYTEQVTVVGYRNLTIKSVVPFAAKIKTPASLNEPYLVGIGVSENVTFQGFRLVVLAKNFGCEQLEFGILTSEATGIIIRGNRIQTNGAQSLTGPCGYLIGIQVGDPSGIASTSIATAVKANPWSGASTASAPISRATLFSNLVANPKLIGIDVSGQGTNADVLNNSVHYFHVKDPQNGTCPVFFPGGALASAGAGAIGVAGSSALCFSIGIAQLDRAGGRIEDNAVLSGLDSLFSPSSTTPLLFAGIVQWDQRHADGKSTLKNNQIFRTIIGAMLIKGDGATVAGNVIWDSVIGIFVHQTIGAVVRNNVVHDNAAGIGINDSLTLGPDYGVTSSGNVIKNNDARDNDQIGHASNPNGYSTTFISCFDNTTGGGTNGTDNTWSNNKGELNSSDPLAICGHASL